MVLVTGLEPVRILLRRILSPLRLPIPPHEPIRKCVDYINIMILQSQGTVSTFNGEEKTRNRNIKLLIEISLSLKLAYINIYKGD